MPESSDRLKLPFIAAGQAQKDVTHNEALHLLDLLVQPVIQAATLAVPPASPVIGQSWLVATGGTGIWSGKDGQIAGWTSAGWIFVAPFQGLSVWNAETNRYLIFSGAEWDDGVVHAQQLRVNNIPVLGAQAPAISTPTGGTTIDSEARLAIAAMLGALRGHGLIDS